MMHLRGLPVRTSQLLHGTKTRSEVQEVMVFYIAIEYSRKLNRKLIKGGTGNAMGDISDSKLSLSLSFF